jgi:hypothetical protein
MICEGGNPQRRVSLDGIIGIFDNVSATNPSRQDVKVSLFPMYPSRKVRLRKLAILQQSGGFQGCSVQLSGNKNDD